MEFRVTFLQALQDQFAAETGLTTVITDSRGCEVTNISGTTPFSDWILKESPSAFSKFVRDSLQSYSDINHPAVLDTLPGLKVILAPVSVSGSNKYFMWAGILIEQEVRAFIHEFVEKNSGNPVRWKQALATVEDTSKEDKGKAVAGAKQTVEVLSKYLTLEENQQDEPYYLMRGFPDWLGAELTVKELLNNILSCCKSLSFLGVAEKNGEESFVVSHLAGSPNPGLVGKSFSLGEGFLGQAAAIGAPRRWANIEKDPRVLFFIQNDVKVNNLFCAPFKMHHDNDTLLFGGNLRGQPFSDKELLIIESLFGLLHVFLRQQWQETRLVNLTTRLTVLTEVTQMMRGIHSIKRILLILVDMSLNLAQGSFSCVVLNPDKSNGNIHVMSRGLTEQQAERYKERIQGDYFSSDGEVPGESRSVMVKAEIGTRALDIPITDESNETIGVLSVGISDPKEVEEIQTLLTSLAAIAGISIHHGDSMVAKSPKTASVEMLHSAMEQWDPVNWKLTEQAAKLAVAFSGKFGFSGRERLAIEQACLLSLYNIELLENWNVDPDVVEMVRVYKGFEKEQKEPGRPVRINFLLSMSCELMVMIFTYLKNDRKLEAVQELIAINSGFRKEFMDYLSGKTGGNSGETHQVDIGRIGEAVNLTAREKDVLKLVIQGYNNREIAKSLFISEHTVKNHVTNIFQKLGVADRSQAIAKVYQS
ncbi:MAG TPA: helix-turn-helix transcriptional regulator [Bacillales bacterium]